MTARVLVGDCRAVMADHLEPDSVHAIVTDPPYGLSFMGKGWDHGVPGVDFWAEALRVAKPGAHLAAFGGTRTHHRLMVAIEDAGWELRDVLMWLYGSGFPKSLNLGVAFDKAEGMGPRGIGFTTAGYTPSATVPGGAHPAHVPTSENGKQWEGWGTALKPAWEPIILARKPFATNVATNVLEHGTGALNIDACRITAGLMPRWPANLVLDDDAATVLDAAAPEDLPARFYYTAKAGRTEREAGLDALPSKPGGSNAKGYTEDVARGLDRNRPVKNHHPTVKPLALMQWLCKLITPKGGAVLDPFCGSGTTGRAAVAEGFSFVGIDISPEYAAIARARITEYAPLFAMVADGP